jgi:hypothetical protein
VTYAPPPLEGWDEVYGHVANLRLRLEQAFAPETSVDGSECAIASAGHCAAAAAIVHQTIGGLMVSAVVNGTSHWFNRFYLREGVFDVDITGDQFGYEAIRVARKNGLFEGTRERADAEVNEDTWRRAMLLATRAGLPPW